MSYFKARMAFRMNRARKAPFTSTTNNTFAKALVSPGFIVGFTLALAVALQLPASLHPLLIILLIVFFLLCWRSHRLLLCGLALGCLLASLSVTAYTHQRFKDPGRHDIAVTGIVESIVETSWLSSRFIFRVESSNVCASPTLSCRVRVSWYKPFPAIKPGQRWQLLLRVKAPRSASNPGSFDYAGWLFTKGIHATAYVRKSDLNRWLAGTRHAWINQFRSALIERLDGAWRPGATGVTSDAQALIKALAVGVRHDVSLPTSAVLRDTGTAHLLAISGMHVGMVAAAGYMVGRRLLPLALMVYQFLRRRLRFFPADVSRLQSPQLLNIDHAGSCVALLFAGLYALMAGFTLPTQRALLMVLLFFLFRVRRRSIALGSVLLIALLPVLVVDLVSPLSAGLWLSFGAVAAICYLSQGRVQEKHNGFAGRWFGIARLQLGLSLMLIPLTITLFNQCSLISPVANLFAIPLVAVLILPLILAGVASLFLSKGIGIVILQLAAQLLDWMMTVLTWLQAVPYASLTFPDLPIGALPAMMLGMLILCNPVVGSWRWLGLVFWLPVITDLGQPRTSGFRVHVLDVGQALSVVIETSHHALVYDTGRRMGSAFSSAESTIIPFLRSLGIQRPDLVLVSHDDSDHSGGLAGMRTAYPGVEVMAPMHFDATIEPDRDCRQGLRWYWDGVELEVLHPAQGSNDRLAGDNDHSCVLRIRYGNSQVLLPGDIEVAGERELVSFLSTLATQGEQQGARYDLIVAPHHGSRSSSTAELLDIVRPKAVVYSVGFGNRFGFPHESVGMRYKLLGAEEYRTDRDGALSFHFGRSGLVRSVLAHRLGKTRPWISRN